MKVLRSYKHFCASSDSIALTIGNFDGVHLGHQAVLNRLKQIGCLSVIFTFSNHPSEVLQRHVPITRLTTLEHRMALLRQIGIDYTILTPFTKPFSKQTARSFLISIKEKIPFSYLILGHDAVIGHDRKNDLSDLAEELEFTLEYLEPSQINGKVISSSEIRSCIHRGDLGQASAFLGRPYSIFATVQKGYGKGGPLGFHTANLPVEDLALPPFGVYAVEVKIDHETYFAVANLGQAPTLHESRPPWLEVHLIDNYRLLYGKELEVFFLKFLRPEKRFESIDALKNQIQNDIQAAKNTFLLGD